MGENENGKFIYDDLNYHTIIPNNNIKLIEKTFGNNSFTKEGAERQKGTVYMEPVRQKNSILKQILRYFNIV